MVRRRGRRSSKRLAESGAQSSSRTARDDEVVPDACQIQRGATGCTGVARRRQPGAETAPSQVRKGAPSEAPKLPRLRARVRLAPARPRGPAGVAAPVDDAAPWLRPVGARRDIRAPGRLARPPSWLAVGG
jgi:hypothetical protein